MATIPRGRNEQDADGEAGWELDESRLPGFSVTALMREGNVEEARAELERLLLEGINSGPGIPVTPGFFDRKIAAAKARIAHRSR